MSGSVAAFAVEEGTHPSIAYADTLGYPYPTDADAPCEFGSAGGATCTNPTNSNDKYDWGVYIGGVFHQYRNGYEYRNCTDYVQWKESTVGVSIPAGWGKAGYWYTNAPASEKSLTPKAWDVAVEPVSAAHPFGHVAFVESVNPDGTITVSEYNHDAHGTGDTRTGTAVALGFTGGFVDFGVHPSAPGNPPPTGGPDSTQVIINHAGEVWARSGVGADGWVKEANAGSAAKVASGGGVQLILDNAGQIWAQSGIGTVWIPETNQYSATSVSVGSDGTQMLQSYDGAVYAKRGVGFGGWVAEASPGSAAEIETNGGIQVIRDGAGQLWVKGNSLDWGGFWAETGQYSALQIAINNDGTQILRSYDGSVYGRANTADSNWVSEAAPGSAAEIAMGNGVQMILDGAGQVWEKGPSVAWGGWSAVTNPSSAVDIAVADDGTQILRDYADELWARSTAANSTWVGETGQGAVAYLG